jgi:transmembrane sensor
MHKIDAKQLLKKYKLGQCTAAEKEIVETWYLKSETENPVPLSEDAINSSLNRVWAKLDNKPLKPTTSKLWPRLTVVAASVAIIAFGVYLFNKNTSSVTNNKALLAQDIGPGKVGATLILANGKRILLSDAVNGQLAKEAGVIISKTSDGQLVYEVTKIEGEPNQINTLSTSKGETYMIILPDKSKVWLNAASSLKYPTSFGNHPQRVVELSGEAYFEVTKDKRSFKVLTAHQNVTVLGTHFNIMAYPEEHDVSTTLLEGSVKVSSTKSEVLLKPGQQSILNKDLGNMTLKAVDSDEAIAWKDDYFLFQGEDIYSIMRKISRWYDIEVSYKGNMENKEFAGMISRFKNISEVLKMLELTGDVHFKIEGRRILVMP